MNSTVNPLHDNHEDIPSIQSDKSSTLFEASWLSVVVVGFIVFVGDSSRGILFPSLFLLCKSLGGTTTDLGYLVAAFSFGRLIATAPLGYYCDRFGHKKSLIIANVILMVGSIVWANAYATGKLSSLYCAQFLMGCGSGTLGVTRSYIVEQVVPEERTNILAIMTALQYAGFTVSPFLGSLLGLIGKTSNSYWEFALPSFFISLISFYSILALVSFFNDIPRNSNTTHLNKSPTQQEIGRTPMEMAFIYVLLLLILLNVATKGSIAVYETLAAEMAATDFMLSSSLFGFIISLSGSVGSLQLLFFKQIWSSRMTDTQLMLVGMFLMSVAQLLLFTFGGVKADLSRFLVCVIIMYSIGYPVGHTAVLGAFSKLQKNGPQAALLGWFASAGSFARIVFPAMAGFLDSEVHIFPFNIVLMLLSLSAIGIIVWKPRIDYFCAALPKIAVGDEEGGVREDSADAAWILRPLLEISAFNMLLIAFYCALFLIGMAFLVFNI